MEAFVILLYTKPEFLNNFNMAGCTGEWEEWFVGQSQLVSKCHREKLTLTLMQTVSWKLLSPLIPK